MHFGYKLHMDCLNEEGIIRNISLPEVPSKFYIGDSYLTQICIVPYIFRSEIKETRVVFDNPIADIILKGFQMFRYLILEVDNYYFSLWKTEDSKFFYFFDGYQKRFDGYLDKYLGFSILFSTNLVDSIIEIIINRIVKISNTSLKIHGLKIIYLKKLSKQEMKSKKLFKVTKMKCIRPFSADDAKHLKDVPSTVDSVIPILSKSQQDIMNEKPEDKPQHLKLTDLNSPSLVCTKLLAYHEIMASLEKKLSTIRQPEVRNETMELVYEVHSEILKKVTGQSSESKHAIVRRSQSKSNGSKKSKKKLWYSCGKYVGVAEKVLIKTDLEALNNEREKLLNTKISNGEFQSPESKQEFVSHFQNLPDGTKIVCGTKGLFKVKLNPRIFDYENFSILVAVSAIITSTRYKISSWSPQTVDYILGCGEIMSGIIELKNRMDFYTHDEHVLPEVQLNKKLYRLSMNVVINGYFKWLEQYLKKTFEVLGKL